METKEKIQSIIDYFIQNNDTVISYGMIFETITHLSISGLTSDDIKTYKQIFLDHGLTFKRTDLDVIHEAIVKTIDALKNDGYTSINYSIIKSYVSPYHPLDNYLIKKYIHMFTDVNRGVKLGSFS